MSATLRNLIGGKRQKKQRQSKKGGKRTQKRRQQDKRQQDKRQRGGDEILQKMTDMLKGGEGEQKMATEALTQAIGGSPDVMAKLQQLLPSQ